jgi:hypothetical protein
MTPVFNGRFTAETDQPFVVFLIGMRINRWWRPDRWAPVALAMGPMLRRLFADSSQGLLHVETWWNLTGPVLVQYWRSFEALEAFARDPAEPHLGAWRRFNQAVGADGSVGIWHETYLIDPDRYECVYGNMPRFGLAAATTHVAAVGRHRTARSRLGGVSVVPAAAYGATAAAQGGSAPD